MRDLLLTLIVLGWLAVVLHRPWTGILLCAWLGYMNPHRLCFGFAYSFPFFAVAGIVTIAALLVSGELKPVPVTRETICLVLLVLWMNVTLVFALNSTDAWPQWSRVMKVQFMCVLGLATMADRRRLHALAWVIALSLGFYGIKGGIFALSTGGLHRVEGPEGSFIEGNNALALALVMVLPLMRYLQLNTERTWVRLGLWLAMILTIVSVFCSYSRGGFLALVTVGLLTWLKSRKRLALALAIAIIIPPVVHFMPQQWFDRMNSIALYQADDSAQGRTNAWHFAWNLAEARPIVGGGFRTFAPELFKVYAPEPDNYHEAHSIYFQILGEHGFPGLLLFLTLGFLTWRSGTFVVRHAKQQPRLKWARDLAAMTQVGLAGFAVGGAFSNLAYFDLPYHFMTFIVLSKVLMTQTIGAAGQEERQAQVLQPVPSVGTSLVDGAADSFTC